MTALQTAITAANEWQAHALPIIRAYYVLEEVSLLNDICANHYGKDTMSKQRTSDYREAQGYVIKAQDALYGMLDGIRDNYLCDQRRSCLVEMTEDQIDEVDRWNDEIDAAVIGVEAAVRAVGDAL